MRVSQIIPIPAVILGLPLRESENPYLVAEVGSTRIEVEVEECKEPSVAAGATDDLAGQVVSFAKRLLKELGLDACINLKWSAPEGTPRAGLYASLTAHILKSVARAYGESLEVYEILEYARLLDDLETGWGAWHSVVDALRYASLMGGTVVYRNDEEYAKLSNTTVRGFKESSLIVKEQLFDKETLGPDLYGALIHTVGVLVLEGAVRVRDSNRKPSLKPLIQLHNHLAHFFWGLSTPEGSILSPGLWPEFERIKLLD
ncbi:MAG: hypothetical protein F7C35_01380 [Desulfurococcales archaeon]|nr:hypothetical protein [Desulfurococcales archaeon]